MSLMFQSLQIAGAGTTEATVGLVVTTVVLIQYGAVEGVVAFVREDVAGPVADAEPVPIDAPVDAVVTEIAADGVGDSVPFEVEFAVFVTADGPVLLPADEVGPDDPGDATDVDPVPCEMGPVSLKPVVDVSCVEFDTVGDGEDVVVVALSIPVEFWPTMTVIVIKLDCDDDDMLASAELGGVVPFAVSTEEL
jgi:hypothetical protein